mgnify:CR=1 FL=1
MTDRIGLCFDRLRASGDKALVTFITAGDPDLSTTASLLPLLEEAGADIIELGVPFSDPMADGPIIQRSSERALAAGTSLAGILSMVKQARKNVSLPIVLMGYSNPIYCYGWEKFSKDASLSGVDAVLLVDLPPEEAGEFLPHAEKNGLKVIFLLTPTSDQTRVAAANIVGGGFIYYVTVTGVTGVRSSMAKDLSVNLDMIRRQSSLPIVAGFGVSDPEQASIVASHADGVVVGSAIVGLFEKFSGSGLAGEVRKLVSSLKDGVRQNTHKITRG